MSRFTVSRHVPYTADQVYAIASDVASYKEFLPLTQKSVVYNRKSLPDGCEVFDSELTVAYRKLGISETMRSRVKADPAKRTVHSTSGEDGPVKHLDSIWHISPSPHGGCTIELKIDYTLKSRSLQLLLSGMFDMVMRKVMTAFEERARSIYGAAA